MFWVTRSHVHVDRVACPWLITRFIDNQAEFLFVPAREIEKVVKETGAIPFDAPGVELGHKDRPLFVRIHYSKIWSEGTRACCGWQDRSCRGCIRRY